jgi:hypothetical protein
MAVVETKVRESDWWKREGQALFARVGRKHACLEALGIDPGLAMRLQGFVPFHFQCRRGGYRSHSAGESCRFLIRHPTRIAMSKYTSWACYSSNSMRGLPSPCKRLTSSCFTSVNRSTLWRHISRPWRRGSLMSRCTTLV